MESSTNGDLHFVLVPWLAQGHIIHMIDIARLLAARGITVSLVTTPANLSRIKPTVDRIAESNLPIAFVPLAFPSAQFGLPDGCENLDSVPSVSSLADFFSASKTLKRPLELYLRGPRTPPPSCVVSDFGHVWTADVARELGVPLVVFQGFSCFAILCIENLSRYKTHETLSDTDPLVLPGLPQRIKILRPQLPRQFHSSTQFHEIRNEIRELEAKADGIVVNSFEELETEHRTLLEKSTGKKVWMIGPVSMCDRGGQDLVERGNASSIDESECSRWLDSKRPNSVVYVCFGSMGSFPISQLKEIGLGLLASNHPFIWVIKSAPSLEFDGWLDDKFAADASRCLVIRGWAPQLMILSHAAVGGFVTHCGWNSSLEGVCAGLPLATWPLFAEQFLNEKLLVEVLGIGVAVGAVKPSDYAGELKDEVAVGRDDVARAVERLMGEAGEERRRRARGFMDAARKAMGDNGSSCSNLTMLIDFVIDRRSKKAVQAGSV